MSGLNGCQSCLFECASGLVNENIDRNNIKKNIKSD